MKIVYWILGLIVVVGIGYLGYRMVAQSAPVALKPVIYLYPKSTTNVSVNIAPTAGLSYTEPTIGVNGWAITATPDGTIRTTDGVTWPYLFWEGNPWNIPTPKEGFVIARADVGSFFDEKLLLLGLNPKERGDFKEYWVPLMQDKPYYFITFVPQSVFDVYAPLTVNPKPDTVIRVFFHHQGLERPISVPDQILTPAPERAGFTLVEWGGNGYVQK